MSWRTALLGLLGLSLAASAGCKPDGEPPPDPLEPAPVDRVGHTPLPDLTPSTERLSSDHAPRPKVPPRIAPPAPRPPAVAPPAAPKHKDKVIAERPAPKPASKKALPQRLGSDRFHIVDSKMATEVVERAPQGVATEFKADVGQLWAFIRVHNEGPPTYVTMLWKRGDEVKSRVELKIGTSGGWRTWSRKRFDGHDIGRWQVETRTADGALLDRMSFSIKDQIAKR